MVLQKKTLFIFLLALFLGGLLLLLALKAALSLTKSHHAASQEVVTPPRLGAAVDSWYLEDPAYAQTLITYGFTSLTPETEMKMDRVEPQQGQFNFTGADAIVQFAQAHHMAVHGHTLVWHDQLPPWLTANEAKFSRDQMIEILHNFISQEVGRYQGKVASWDVVNEGIADNGGLRNTIWSRKIGPDYIEMAFRFVHEADPNAKLYYNDYGAENINNKSNVIYALVKNLRQKGVPIDGVGLQAHLGENNNISAASLSENMQRFADIGVAVRVSELDYTISNTSSSTLNHQADVYRAITTTCAAHSNCTGVTTWGLYDKQSWRGVNTHPLLFDENYVPKPAYTAVAQVLGITPGAPAIPTQSPVAPVIPTVVPAVKNPIGYFDSVTTQGLTGWSCDADDVYTPLTIHFYADGPAGKGQFVGQTLANVQREPAVAALCGGNPYHGFSTPLPASLRDGKSHIIYAYAINIGSGTNVELSASPKVLTLSTSSAPVAVSPVPAPTTQTPVVIPPSSTTITIYAAGTPYAGVYPTMQLLIDGSIVQTWSQVAGNPSTRSFHAYTYVTSRPVQHSQVRVNYPNDSWGGPNGGDRNLVVDKVVINGVAYESEAATTLSTGAWVGNHCGTSYSQTEWLYCKGYFQY